MALDPLDPRPPFRQIADRLREKILSGQLAPGDRLPSERELVETYGTAHATVRNALALLRSEGLIVTHRGKGAFVRLRPLRLRLKTNHLFVTQAREQGRTAEVQLLGVERLGPPIEIAERLQLPPDERAVARRYLMLIDNQPMQLVTSYFSATLVGRTAIARSENISPGRIDSVLVELGREPRRLVDELIARMPGPDEVRHLRLLPGTPVVNILRTYFDQSGDPIEVARLVLASDRHELVYEMEYPSELLSQASRPEP